MKPKAYRATITVSRKVSREATMTASVTFASQNFKTRTAAFKHSWNLAQGLEKEVGGGCVAIEKLTRGGWSMVGCVFDGKFSTATK